MSVKNSHTTTTELFFHLIRCGIGKQSKLPHSPNRQQWNALFDIAQKQTLVGIAFAGIKALPKEQLPPKNILFSWHNASELIKKENINLNKKCAAISKKFRQQGFGNCILKGQGIAQLYPEPALRTPGDIDIWLDGGYNRILEYVKKGFPKCRPTYHHVNFPIKKGVDIEIHFTPSWMHNPIKNARLQKFFTENAAIQFNNETRTAESCFPAPTATFNRIYILLHIYRHLFQEGIGLRQLLDYHFVLEHGFSQKEREECKKTLKELGLEKFAAATTYILQEKFGLESEKQIVPPDCKRGEFLLNEVMKAGNFGKYDSRYSIVSKENEFRHFLNSMKRIARLAFQYPGETLWSPYFKIWHFVWRKRRRG